jgi:hypothetical protein
MGNLEKILPIAITDPIYDYGFLNRTLIKNTSKFKVDLLNIQFKVLFAMPFDFSSR